MTNIELLEYSKDKITEARNKYGNKFRIIIKTNDHDCLEFLYQDHLGVVHEVYISAEEVHYKSENFPQGATRLIELVLIDIERRQLLSDIINSMVSSLVGRF